MLSKYFLEHALRKLITAPAGDWKVRLYFSNSMTWEDVAFFDIPCSITIDAQNGFALVSCKYEDTSTTGYEADAASVWGGFTREAFGAVWPVYLLAISSGLDIRKTSPPYPIAFHLVIDSTMKFTEAVSGGVM